MEKKITFRRNYFFGGNKKDKVLDGLDFVNRYIASNGVVIDVHCPDTVKWYTINDIPFATLKEAKDYVMANA